MPTYQVPIEATKDLPLSATFYWGQYSELGMVALFVQPYTFETLPMSATFLSEPQTATLHQSATFEYSANLTSHATFVPGPSTVNLPMSAAFYIHNAYNNLASSATFLANGSLNQSATFFQPNNNTLSSNANFICVKTLPMNSTFYLSAFNQGLTMKAFFGIYNATFSMNATFLNPGTVNFSAQIVIQQYIPPS